MMKEANLELVNWEVFGTILVAMIAFPDMSPIFDRLGRNPKLTRLIFICERAASKLGVTNALGFFVMGMARDSSQACLRNASQFTTTNEAG